MLRHSKGPHLAAGGIGAGGCQVHGRAASLRRGEEAGVRITSTIELPAQPGTH